MVFNLQPISNRPLASVCQCRPGGLSTRRRLTTTAVQIRRSPPFSALWLLDITPLSRRFENQVGGLSPCRFRFLLSKFATVNPSSCARSAPEPDGCCPICASLRRPAPVAGRGSRPAPAAPGTALSAIARGPDRRTTAAAIAPPGWTTTAPHSPETACISGGAPR